MTVRKKLLFSMLALILAFGFLEVVARVAVWMYHPFGRINAIVMADPVMHHTYIPSSSPKGLPYTLHINSQSWPEDHDIEQRKPAGVYRIFMVGDSNTQGYVDPQARWVTIVGKELNKRARRDGPSKTRYEVINAGRVSYSPLLYYLHIKNQILSYSPDLVVINVDMTDNIDCVPVGVNLSHACARTAAMVGVFNSLPQSVPANAGSFRRIDVALRENCVVGIPRHPTCTSVATTNLADRVTNAVQRALAEIDARTGMAEGGAGIPPASGVLSGRDPRQGDGPFVNEVILAAGGGPGTFCADGWLSLFTMGNAGMPFYDSIEIDELHHPIRITARRIVPDTEGAGAFRGAPGILTEFRPVGTDVETRQ